MSSYYPFCMDNKMIDMIISIKKLRKNERKENANKRKRKPHVFYIFKSCVHRTLIGKM